MSEEDQEGAFRQPYRKMNALDGLEMFIPEEAQVKSIAIWSLPSSMIRAIGLPTMDPKGIDRIADSPLGIWICPAVLRSKDHGSAQRNAASLLTAEFQLARSPLKIAFVSSSVEAYNVLKDNAYGKGATRPPHTALLSPEVALHSSEDFIIIYNEQLYLMMRNVKPSQRVTCKAQQPIIAHSASSAERQTELNDSEPVEQHITCEDTRGDKVEDFIDKETDWSSSQTADELREDWDAVPNDNQKLNTSLTLDSDFCSTQKEDFDFNELEQREKIAQIKAKLKQNKAALNSLHTPK
uniref:uncharacterized protein LOC131104607 isoform X1 n=1 Tax=Doryrhamphus excisus TaxID=161450 RepID=UPI0025AE5528|nr:uncharacterized protein LOC131104607 isoform X1 [Doryrhamphus excisus]